VSEGEGVSVSVGESEGVWVRVVLLGLSRRFLLNFKYCTNKSEYLHGGRSHQKVVRASAKLKNPISHFRVI
jgi:hypothetical protein